MAGNRPKDILMEKKKLPHFLFLYTDNVHRLHKKLPAERVKVFAVNIIIYMFMRDKMKLNDPSSKTLGRLILFQTFKESHATLKFRFSEKTSTAHSKVTLK